MPRLSDLLGESTDTSKLSKLAKPQPAGNGGKKPRNPVPPARPRPDEHRRPAPVTASPIIIPDFVALDFETTGLDQKSDRITEVGAVKFVRGEQSGTFHSLVCPGIPIPAMVTALTGITDEAVAGAPPFSEILKGLMEFIGRLPICGHQVDFDVNFLNEELKRHGLERLQNFVLDTAVLSRLALPNIGGYSLSEVARHVGVPLVNAHRALDDAAGCGRVAVAVIPLLGEIAPHVRRIMASFAPPSLLRKILQQSVDSSPAVAPPLMQGVRVDYGRLDLPEEIRFIDTGDVAAHFGADGSIATVVPGFFPRPCQTEMAQQVAEALNTGDLLAVEAGTGTGKSLAYLIPAAMHALANNTRVLISTHTRNLQDQLAGKDLPLANTVLGGKLRFCVLKGRANYLCLRRYRLLLSGALGNFSIRDRAGLLPLIRWAEQTETGDIEEQQQFNRKWYARVWNLISAESHECMGPRCPLFDRCFLQTARRKAQGAHVVVVNHALFYADACSESWFLRPVGTVIFDEAHHLESVGHQALRTEVDSNRMNNFLDLCADTAKGFEVRREKGMPQELETDMKKLLKRARKNGLDLMQDLADWARTNRPADQQSAKEYQFPVADEPYRSFSSLAGFIVSLDELADVLRHTMQWVDEQPHDDILCDFRLDVQTLSGRVSQLKADLKYVTAALTEDHVFWIEGDLNKGWTKVCGVPLDIGGMLAGVWERNRFARVFTSATLSVAGDLSFFASRIGLDRTAPGRMRTAVFASPFAPSQSVRCALRSGPVPDDAAFAPHCATVLLQMRTALHRNMLVLFTANAMLNAVDAILRKSTELPRESLITQGISGSRHVMLERFKQSSGCILLGAASFWEGVDAPGEACEIVVIPRLPFMVPSHPVKLAQAARAQKEHGESFMSMALPEAVIKFRQGAGRLIRTAGDRGALVVLDVRAVTKGYGAAFGKSLPGRLEPFESADEMVERIGSFFVGDAEPKDSVTYVPMEE